MDHKAAAAAIRKEIDPGFSAKVARDENAIVGVMRELGVADTPANRFQVAAALYAKGVETKEAFPKMMYRRSAEGKLETMTAGDEVAEKALTADGWSDTEPQEGAPAKAKPAKAK